MKANCLYNALSQKCLAFWHSHSKWAWTLLPFAWLFQGITFARFKILTWKNKETLPIPVIVVGNISLGGTGKTPFVIWLVEELIKKGYRPGVILRGYGGNLNKQSAMAVQKESDPLIVGDEALLLAKKCACPVVVGKKRLLAAKYLLTQFSVNVIISDDGLQHYALPRDVEIVVVDGEKRFGNGFCLPAGPLRESLNRLKRVDFVVTNGSSQEKEWSMETTLKETLYHVNDVNKICQLSDFIGKKVHMVAAVGNPKRFHQMLLFKGIEVIVHAFPDHHFFQEKDFLFQDNYPILMTEKDAVKCQTIFLDKGWVVGLDVKMPFNFVDNITRKITHGSKATRYTSLSHM